MAANTLFISNLTSNNISLEGDDGNPKIFVSGATAAGAVEVNPRVLIENDLLCASIATLITDGDIRVNRGSTSGTLITAAVITSYKDGTYWDTDQDGLLDDNADVVLNNAHRTGNGADHANVALNDGHRTTVTGNPHNVTRLDLDSERVVVTSVAVDTLANEQSTALTGAATDEWVPLYAIFHMEDVGAGAAATGDASVSIGITSGGTEILAGSALTGLVNLNSHYKIEITGLTEAIPGDSTIYVTVTAADSTAGAGHLVDAYIVGESFLSA